MSIDELKKVLAKIQLGDNRQVDSLTLREWFDTIGHLDFDDTIAAVTMHRIESTNYLLPAHLVALVRRIREDRFSRVTAIELKKLEGKGSPKPKNFDAMVAAWDNQEKFAAEVSVYEQQLSDREAV